MDNTKELIYYSEKTNDFHIMIIGFDNKEIRYCVINSLHIYAHYAYSKYVIDWESDFDKLEFIGEL